MRDSAESLIQDIYDVALGCRLADANARESIFDKMPGQVVARFPLRKRPNDQLYSDLMHLWDSWSNEVVGVERGLYEPPLATWLHEASKWVTKPDGRRRLKNLRERALRAQDALKTTQDALARAVAEAEAKHGNLSHKRLTQLPAVSTLLSSYIEAKRKLRSTRLRTGAFIADRYRIDVLVGRGSAEVWTAFDAETCRYVALKILTPTWQSDGSGYRERFLRGARCMQNLNHQNIVRVFEIHTKSSFAQPFYSMQYHPAGDVKQLLENNERTPAECLEIVLNAAEGLAFAHERDIVHRDVKPANILLASNGSGCLTDFDLVWSMMTTGGTRGALGTPDYMAPEMRSSSDTCRPSADVYSLGMTVAYVVNHGHLPAWMNHNRDRFLSALPGSDAIKQVLYRSTAIDPRERPRNARMFVDEINAALREGPALVSGRPVGDQPPTGVGLNKLDDVERYLGILGDENMPPGLAQSFEENLKNPEKRPLFCQVLEKHYQQTGDEDGLERILRARLEDVTRADTQAEIWLDVARINQRRHRLEAAFEAYGEALRCRAQDVELVDTLSELARQLDERTPRERAYHHRLCNLLEQHLDRVVDATVASNVREQLVDTYTHLLDVYNHGAGEDSQYEIDLLHDIARHHRALENWSSLLSVWRRLIALTSGSEQQIVRTQLAYLLEVCDDAEVADVEAAIHMYGQLLDEDPDHRTSLERLQALYTREDLRRTSSELLERHYRRTDTWDACIHLLKDRLDQARTQESLRDAHLDLGRIYQIQLAEHEQALNHYESAFVVDPTAAGARANFYALAGELQAEDRVRTAILQVLDGPVSATTRLALLMRLVRLTSDVEQKRHYLDQILKTQPSQRWVLGFLAQSYRALGARGRQCDALELRLPLLKNPVERAGALVHLARLHIEMGRPLADSLRALSLTWSEGARTTAVVDAIGQVLVCQGSAFDTWLDDEETAFQHRMLGLGHLALADGLDKVASTEALDMLASLDVAAPGDCYVIAKLLFDGRRWTRARHHLERIDLREFESDQQALVLQLLGRINEELEEGQKAIEAYEGALKADPTQLEVVMRLADLYEGAGRREELQGLLGDLLALNPSPQIRLRMAWNAVHIERPSEALEHLRAVMYSDFPDQATLNEVCRCLRRLDAWQDFLILLHRFTSQDTLIDATLEDTRWVTAMCACLQEEYGSTAIAWSTIRSLATVVRRQHTPEVALELLQRFTDGASRGEPDIRREALSMLVAWDHSDVDRRYALVEACLRSGHIAEAHEQLKLLDAASRSTGVTNHWVALQARAFLLEGRGADALALTTNLVVSARGDQQSRALHAWALLTNDHWQEAHRALIGSEVPLAARTPPALKHPLRDLGDDDFELVLGD